VNEVNVFSLCFCCITVALWRFAELRTGKTQDLYYADMDRMEWQRPENATGERPSARDGAAGMYDEEGGRLLIFGGRNVERKRLNDLHSYTLSTNSWAKLVVDGAPSPRECATTCSWGQLGILFGGHGSGMRYNDIHFYEMHSNSWSQPQVTGTPPSPRQDAAMCVLNNKLYLHGGRNNFVLDDLFVLDLNTLVWAEVNTIGRKPAARYLHSLSSSTSPDGVHSLWVYGGKDELGGVHITMFRMTLEGESSGFAKRPEWIEYDPQMNFNECHLTFFNKARL
jgi:N-acetylneuraminic acid mutarotase